MLKFKSFYARNLYFTNDNEDIKRVQRYSKLVDNDEYEMFYETTEIEGVISYGCKQLFDDREHDAGYVWASRPSCVNKEWGTKYLHAYVDNRAYGIDSEVAINLIEKWLKDNNKGHYVVKVVKEHEDKEDLRYIVEIYDGEKRIYEL